jgi:hypothetical protein
VYVRHTGTTHPMYTGRTLERPLRRWALSFCLDLRGSHLAKSDPQGVLGGGYSFQKGLKEVEVLLDLREQREPQES